MNIVLLSREFPPFRGGGIGTYTEQAAHALSEAGHRVTVLTVSHDGSSSRGSHATDPGIEVIRLPLVIGEDWSRPAPAIDTPETRAMFVQMGPWSVFSRAIARTLPSIIRERDVQVVEAPECGALLWWTLNEHRLGREPFARADGGRPVFVAHLHSPNTWIDEENRQSPPNRPALELREAERLSAQWADLVISPSRDLAAWATDRWSLRSVSVVPYPIGFMRPVTDPARLFGGSVRALLVGRMEPRKGIDILVRAVAICARQSIDITAELAGQDTRDWRTGAWFAHRSIRTLLPVEHGACVHAIGKLDAGSLEAARQRANVCVAPGAFDNFPYAVMESMASGLPIIAPRFGGVSELVRDGVDGLLFEPHDSASLAGAIARFASLDASSRTAMGSNAAQRVADFCSNHRAVETRERVFSSAIHAISKPASTSALSPARCIGGESAPLLAIVESGRADFACGWTRDPRGELEVGGAPTSLLLAAHPRACTPLAVRADLVDAFRAEHASNSDDADLLLAWLAAKGYHGAVDCSVIAEKSACSNPNPCHESLFAGQADTFNASLSLHMAGRAHPSPWPIVPVPAIAALPGSPIAE